jgi:hypothetical protein
MTKVAAFLSAPLAVAAVALTMSGAAFAQEIGCVDGIPAPPITHSCPSTSPNGSFAQAPASHVSSRALKHRASDGRDGVRHVSQ